MLAIHKEEALPLKSNTDVQAQTGSSLFEIKINVNLYFFGKNKISSIRLL